MTSPSLTANQAELAELFEVSAKTVQQWDRQGLRDAARLEGGKRDARYDVAAAIKWVRARDETALRELLTIGEDEELRLRKLRAEAEQREYELGVKRGDYVPMDDVELLVRESFESVDAVLRHAPSRFAPALAKLAKVSVKQARTILRDLIELVRGSIREEGEKIA